MTRIMTPLSFAMILIISPVSQVTAGEMPPVVRAALGRFVGEWNMEFMIDGATVKGAGTVKWSDNELSLIMNSKVKNPVNGEELSSTGVFGWDGAREIVVEHAFISDGSWISATHPVSEDGKWTSPTHGWTLMEGKPTYEETVRYFKWTSDDELHIEIKIAAPAGGQNQDIKCVFRRK